MSEVQTHAPGVPSWIDLASADLERSRQFYTRLFGWEAFTVPDPDAGGYGFFLKDGKQVAGYGPVQSPEQPSAWSIYVSANNADEAAEKVRAAGGQVIAGPFDVFDQGRMAVCTDPTGAFISVWQGARHQGAELLNAPGAFCWAELHTRDTARAKEFYRAVFGWDETTSASGDTSYTEWKLDGRSIAGMMEMGPQIPPSVPPYWLAYITVENVDETLQNAEELGSQVVFPATNIDLGRFALLSDPVGATLGIMQFNR